MNGEQVVEFLEQKGEQVALVGYLGSQHFGITDDLSDIDYLAFTVPELRDLLTNTNRNGNAGMGEGQTVNYNTLGSLARNIHKLSFNILEVVSQPLYIEPDFKPVYEEMRELLLSKEGNSHCLKNLYFIGWRYYKDIHKESQGSGALHMKDGINYKAVAKAVFYKELLETYHDTKMLTLYESNEVKESIKQTYLDIRLTGSYDRLEQLDEFYNDTVKLTYIKQTYKVDTNKVLDELTKYLTLKY